MSLAMSRDPGTDAASDPYAAFWPWKESGAEPEALPEWVAFDEKLLSGILAFRTSSYPTAENIAAAAAWNPGARRLLGGWKTIWDRSFPDGLPDKVLEHRNEGPSDRRAEVVREFEEAVAKGHMTAAADAAWWLETNGDAEPDVGHRAWQAHVVDDAESTVALRHAVPGDAFVSLGYGWKSIVLALDRHDDDGVPILVLGGRNRVADRLDRVVDRVRIADDAEYWRSPAFLAAAGRGFAIARSEAVLCMVLASMARQGHRRAFLKGVDSKSETWTVDLVGVRDATSALHAFQDAVVPSRMPGSGMIVQEHVPFLREQRFFVVGGRIVASVCSDRNHSAVDARRNRILDDRVARLDVPEIDRGSYDRGRTTSETDRALSAAFARSARRIVRSLAAEGTTDYVLDMGETERGVLPIELNSLYTSGPYSLDRIRIVRARNRLRTEALAAAWSKTEEMIRASAVAPVAEEEDGYEAFPRGIDHVGAKRAMTGFSLSRIAAAVVSEKPRKTMPTRFRRPGEGLSNLRRVLDDAVQDDLERYTTDESGVLPVGGPLEDAAFARMPGFDPLFSIVFEGPSHHGLLGLRRESHRALVSGSSSVSGRICGAVLRTPEGPVLAMTTAIPWNGEPWTCPAGRRAPCELDVGYERDLFSDRRKRVAGLSVVGTERGSELVVGTHLDGRTERTALRMAHGESLRTAQWIHRGGVLVPEVPVDRPEPSDADELEALFVEPVDGHVGAGDDEDVDFGDGPKEPVEDPSRTVGDRRRLREDGSERVASWRPASDDGRRLAASVGGLPVVMVVGVELPSHEGETPWEDGCLVICEADRQPGATAYRVAVAGLRDGRWEAGVVDYRLHSGGGPAYDVADVVRRSVGSDRGCLLKTGGQEIHVRVGWSRKDACGRRDRVLVLIVQEKGRIVGYREAKLHGDQADLASSRFDGYENEFGHDVVRVLEERRQL